MLTLLYIQAFRNSRENYVTGKIQMLAVGKGSGMVVVVVVVRAEAEGERHVQTFRRQRRDGGGGVGVGVVVVVVEIRWRQRDATILYVYAYGFGHILYSTWIGITVRNDRTGGGGGWLAKGGCIRIRRNSGWIVGVTRSQE